MTLRVEIKPSLLSWACERSGATADAFVDRFPKLPQWIGGETQPTLKQLEAFAKATHTPIGYLFLAEPPEEPLPIADMRTMRSEAVTRPSPDLLDTLYICQQRQEWYQEFARSAGIGPCPFVGSATLQGDPVEVAQRMREALRLNLEERSRCSTWTECLRRFIEQADEAGVLVMVNGVVGSNNNRKLNPDEFRGFALADKVAPLVFINGADTKAAQMFTLAHELAHIWLGETALSNAAPNTPASRDVEGFCNRVAAELLVPLTALKSACADYPDPSEHVNDLARRFKVSTLVVLRRLFDAGFLTREQLSAQYGAELQRLLSITKGSGGDFYLTQAARVGKRFARALVVSTLEGHTLHRDAFRLLGFSKLATFQKLGHSLGVA